jgi:pimeloyl-ACP methyl ester carboxylesterase
VRKHYKIDENRITVRGFSMGGAACWQFAVHFPGKWAAAAPGAGFSETPDFLKVFQNEKLEPHRLEQKLWHMYDCTDYAANFFQPARPSPTAARIDKQKQAADMMAAAMQKEGSSSSIIIGPKTAHGRTRRRTKESLIKAGRRDRRKAATRSREVPIHRPWTRLYNESLWVTVDWQWASTGRRALGSTLAVGDSGVKATTVECHRRDDRHGRPVSAPLAKPKVTLDDQSSRPAPRRRSAFHKAAASGRRASRLRRPAQDARLCGPIDHAFMDSFVMVKPTGKPLNEKVGAWAAKEMQHAVDHGASSTAATRA